ncbi:MAG TPA: ATP-binding protein [Myxococcaceae bacterium]|jgi:PAS domain S-box-containing protein
MRVLLVTADPCPELVGELRRLGHSVTAEAQLEQVQRLLASEEVEVLLVESTWLAAEPRGLERVRERAAPGLRVVGLAAARTDEHLERLLAAGVEEWLVAPYEPAEVRARLRLLEQRVAEARRQQSQERLKLGEVGRLADIIQLQSDIMQAGLDLHRVMKRICEQARSLCGAEGAAVGILEGSELVYRVTVGSVERTEGFRLPVEKSLTGATVLRAEVLRTGDTETDTRVNREATRKLGIRSMITVPLRIKEQVAGVLNIISTRPHAFQEQDLRTMELLAVMLGAAMTNAAEYEAKQALVAEHQAALTALQESQVLFDSFMNHNPALAYMKDTEGRRVWVNEPYRRFHRLEGVDTRMLQDEDLLPPELVERVREEDRRVLASEQPAVGEMMLPAPDGTPHHWLTYRFVVRDGTGQRFLGCVAMNITQRKQAEAALRRSEESFRSLIEGSPEAIFVHRGGPLVYVNPSALSFLGLPASEVVGASVLRFVHPDDQEVATGLLDARPGQLRSGACEMRFLRPNGRVATAEVSCQSLLFHGEPATVVSARDLTERKQIQSRLVMSDRLVAMGTLAAGVAHEINNPLSFVISNLSFLADELRAVAAELPEGRTTELEEVVREAEMGADRVRQIVSDLKTFSRADDDVPTAVNLQSVLESALTIARAELRSRAKVVRDFTEVPPVEGSEGRFGQVFLNLLINAAQSIPLGQPDRNEIRVRLRAVQDHVMVEVKDTGAGIPLEMRSRIFDPFFTTKPVGEGTGLGLFVCQGIVTRFGGEISVESQVGQGTTFRVIFPMARGGRAGWRPPEREPARATNEAS